ncbi:hypothetical protein LCGC14_2108870, partial [marine sediment metagenome]
PEAVRLAFPEVEWFIIQDTGCGIAGAKNLTVMKQGLMQQHHICFVQTDRRIDGKIIHTGEEVDSLIAGLGPRGLLEKPKITAFRGSPFDEERKR